MNKNSKIRSFVAITILMVVFVLILIPNKPKRPLLENEIKTEYRIVYGTVLREMIESFYGESIIYVINNEEYFITSVDEVLDLKSKTYISPLAKYEVQIQHKGNPKKPLTLCFEQIK